MIDILLTTYMQVLYIHASGAHLDDPVHACVAWTADRGDGIEGRDGESVGRAEG